MEKHEQEDQHYDVLDMSRIESGNVVIEEAPCSLPKILQDIRSMTQVDVEAKGLSFHMDDSALDDAKLARLPIVAMTADAFEEDRQRASAAGMDGHLGKPVDTDKLFAALQRILGGA